MAREIRRASFQTNPYSNDERLQGRASFRRALNCRRQTVPCHFPTTFGLPIQSRKNIATTSFESAYSELQRCRQTRDGRCTRSMLGGDQAGLQVEIFSPLKIPLILAKQQTPSQRSEQIHPSQNRRSNLRDQGRTPFHENGGANRDFPQAPLGRFIS